MSTRQVARIKKMLEQKNKKEIDEEEPEEETTDIIDLIETTNKTRFAGLDVFGDSSDSEESEEEEEEPKSEEPKDEPIVEQQKPSNSQKSKRNQKKKQNVIVPKAPKNIDISALLEEDYLNTTCPNKWLEILKINPKFLNEETERRNTFTEDEETKNPMLNNRRRHNIKNTRKSIRNFYFVTPEDDWPVPPTHISNGFGMVIDDDPTIIREKGCTYYKFIFSKLYKDLNDQLESISSTLNFSDLQIFSGHNIYHVQSQLLMSDLLLGNQQIAESYQLLKRILFVFECSIHPKFNVSQNTNRILYYKEDNQFYFQTLFKYLQSLWRRGYNKTALNIANMMLSLDPEADPMGIIHILDFLAITTGNYKYLINFYESAVSIHSINVQYYPNIIYGYAISLFEEEEKENCNIPIEERKSTQMLLKSIKYYPQAIPLIIKETNTNTNEWKEIINKEIFNRRFILNDIEKLVELMCKRMKDLLHWLYQTCQILLNTLPSSDNLDELSAEIMSIFSIELSPFNTLNPSDYLDSIPRVGFEWFMNDHVNENVVPGNIDPHSNLFQIFLQSLLPWNELNTDELNGGGGDAGENEG